MALGDGISFFQLNISQLDFCKGNQSFVGACTVRYIRTHGTVREYGSTYQYGTSKPPNYVTYCTLKSSLKQAQQAMGRFKENHLESRRKPA